MRRKCKQTEFQCGGCGEFLPNEGFCNDTHAALAKSLKIEEAKHAKNVVLHFSKAALDSKGYTVNHALDNFRELLRQEHDTARAQRASRREVPATASSLRLRVRQAPRDNALFGVFAELSGGNEQAGTATAPVAESGVADVAPSPGRSFRETQQRLVNEMLARTSDEEEDG